jgi:two-component system CheB/CheR fusion protein
MAFVVVLHLSKDHESHLAEILQGETRMKVTQVQETLVVEPNTVYVIPPGKHLTMVDGVVKLVDPDQPLGRRVPIDLLFRTLGDAHGKNSVCIVLSGTGSDGTLGLKRVKESGGIAFVQDPAEAEFDEMPRSAIETNLADLVLPVAEMPAKLMRLKVSAANFRLPDDIEQPPQAEIGADALREVLTLLRVQTGHDFYNYKRPTLLRRVARRMMVREVADIPGYLEFLREHPEELQSLLRDLLISVTNFFRDSVAFRALETEIIPKLFHGKGGGDQVRVWVAACATGEEAYSIAILLSEYAETILEDPPTIQIFASDIDEQAIATARNGYYSDTIAADVSPERLSQFFIKEDGHYRVKKSLREMVLFAQHNLLRDPPFSRIDLVSCRNLLIYLNRKSQEAVFEIFRFALNNEGFLLLGLNESAEGASMLFTSVDKKHRIYMARAGASGYRSLPTMPVMGKWPVGPAQIPVASVEEAVPFGEIHHKLIEKYAPPSVLVNDDYDIVHSSDTVGRYLRFIGGEPTRNLLKVVHPELGLDLRAALIEANQEHRAAESRDLRVNLDGEDVSVNIFVRPCETPDGLWLVMFEESPATSGVTELADIKEGAAESIVRRLGEELQRTKDRLRVTIEQNETSVEELRASNEELQAINEELRSVSEELETSKEELQSVNEELTTVNHELKDKIDEVNQSASDMQNLMSSTDIGTIFLDLSLRIKRYTPAVQALFNIIPSDIGRPLEHLTHKLDYDDLVKDAGEVLRTLKMFEREVHSKEGRTYITRFLPYRTLDEKVDGIVLSFIDIEERKRGDETRRWLSAVVSSSSDAIMSFTLDRKIVSWNAGATRVFGYKEEEVLGHSIAMLLEPQQDHVQTEIFARIERGELVSNYETRCVRKNGEIFDVSLSVSPIIDERQKMLGITATVKDITERKLAQHALQEVSNHKDQFLAMLAHELRNPLMPIMNALEIIQHAECNQEMIDTALGILERQTGQVVHLIDDLLDMSRVTGGKIKLKIERIELRAALDMAVETSRSQIDAAGHTLTVSLPPRPIYIDADLTRIAQIGTNLLNNAARYTPPGGQIWLEVELKGEKVEVRVRDTGIGIPGEMLSRIFEMYTQIDDESGPARAGLGIGLSLVKNLLEMHGGTISAHSEGRGMGSEFVFLLPVARDQSPTSKTLDQQPEVAEQSADTPLKRPRILVVDDNKDSAATCQLLLAMEHYEVRTAFDGESAVAAALEFQPDTCLLDIGLPDITGYEVARRIREKLPEVLLIAVTGLGQEQDRRRTEEAGFNHHLIKPVRSAELKKLLMESGGVA